ITSTDGRSRPPPLPPFDAASCGERSPSAHVKHAALLQRHWSCVTWLVVMRDRLSITARPRCLMGRSATLQRTVWLVAALSVSVGVCLGSVDPGTGGDG